MFRPPTSRWFFVPVLLIGLVALASPAWAHGGFSGGHSSGGHGYYGGHSYYSPYYYGHSYTPSWRSYGLPYGTSYGYSAPAYGGTSYPLTYSYPATSSDYARARVGSGGGCR